jgi:hypothetical protein
MVSRHRTLPIFISALVTIGLLGLYGWSVEFRVEQRISDDRVIELTDSAVGQTLLAHFPGLTRISLRVADSPEFSTDSLQATLSTLSDGTEEIVVEPESMQIKQDGDMLVFQFEPQMNNPETIFLFSVANSGSMPVRLLAHSLDMYPEGSIIHDQGDMVFNATFTPSLMNAVTILLTRLSDDKPGVLGHPWTYLFLFTLLTTAVVGFIFEANRAFGNPSDFSPEELKQEE